MSHFRPSLALIEVPDEDVITVADVKSALGITTTTQDDMIEAALAAVISQIDPATGGWLGRALRPQTWEYRLAGFSSHKEHNHYWGVYIDRIELPIPPLIEIVSVKYDDIGGVERTLVEDTDFRVLGSGTYGKQAIAPLYNGSWPTARYDAESVRIRFTAGYEDGEDPELPKAITQAIILGVRSLVSSSAQNLFLSMDRVEGVGEKRYVVSSAANDLIRSAMQNLLSTYRVY